MDKVGFVAEPNYGRGTITILWSCLTTIFLSTWTSLHLDYEKNYRANRLFYSLGCLLLPEVFVVGMIEDVWSARQLRAAMHATSSNWRCWSWKQSFLIRKECILLDNEDGTHEAQLLEGNQLLEYLHSGQLLFEDIPTDKQIDQRSKSDWLAKLIAIGQATWFAASLLSRLVEHQQISPLEDMAFAYVVCGLAMFVGWFNCPQDVQEPFHVRLRAAAAADKVVEPGQGRDSPIVSQEIPDLVLAITTLLLLMVFVGIHLAAWNYPFPSEVEAWLWRGASIATWCSGTGVVFYMIADEGSKFSLTLMMLVYSICRLIVIGVAFAAFRSAPVGIYEKPSWSAYWGHIGG